MKYCAKCVMPTSRPGLLFDEEGVCSACRWYEKKLSIDWKEKYLELREICDKAKKDTKAPWDCVVGVSGGKDSTWQALCLKYEFGMNPLLVQYSCSEGSELGRINLENLVNHGFSLMSFHPSSETARKLSKISLKKFGNIVKYSESALFPAPFKVAMSYGIPLVFFGENPALECGDTNLTKDPSDATSIRFNNTLSNSNLDTWCVDGIKQKDILPYQFPPEADIQEWNGKGIFMGYYLNWSGYRNALVAIQQGFKCTDSSPKELGDVYKHNSVDFSFISVHSMIKHLKLGFGNVTEFVSYDVRAGRLTREEAILLVREFDGKCGEKFLKAYCNWVELSVEEFNIITDNFRGPMWDRSSKTPKIIDPIWEQEVPSDLNVATILKRIDTETKAASIEKLPILEKPWLN